jgi:hypothetical protein
MFLTRLKPKWDIQYKLDLSCISWEEKSARKKPWTVNQIHGKKRHVSRSQIIWKFENGILFVIKIKNMQKIIYYYSGSRGRVLSGISQ